MIHPDEMRMGSAEAWWSLKDPEKMADAMHERAAQVDDDNADLKTAILQALSMYGVPREQLGHLAGEQRRDSKPRENLLASVVDSWNAQVTHERPRTMFMTTGGSATEQKRTKDVTAYCDAKNDAEGVLGIRRKCMRDAGLHGLGYYRWYVDHLAKRVRCERVHPLNIGLPRVNGGADAMPRELFIHHFFEQRALLAMYPDHKEAIQALSHPSHHGSVMADPRADVVEVIEAWHLPSLPPEAYETREEWEKKTDGMHCFGVRGATFFEEKYDQPKFPGVFFYGLPPDSGIWGISFTSRIKPLQLESDKLRRMKSNAMHVMSAPRWAMKVGDFHSTQMVNNVGSLIKTKSGNPPIPMTPRAMNPEVTEELADLRRAAFAVAGMSEHFASATKTPNVNSGRQELINMDNRSLRLVEHVSMYEEGSVQGDYDLIKRTRELDAWMTANGHGSLEVLYKRKGVPHRVPWQKLNIDDDRLLVQAFPTSQAMRDPSMKMKLAGEWKAEGFIDNDQYARLIGIPEIESEQRLMTSPRDFLEEAWDRCLTGEGEYMPPDGALDPELTLRLTPRAILRAVLDKHTEAEVNKLRNWYIQAQKLFAPKPPPAPPMPPMDPMMDPMMDPAGGLPPMDPSGMPPMGGPPPMPGAPPGAPPMPPPIGMI